MSRSLAAKLIAAFLLVSVAGAALTTLFARWATYREFETLVLDQAENTFVSKAATYYQLNGSWRGVRRYFGLGESPVPRPTRPPPPALPPRPGRNPPPGGPPLYAFALADAEGVIVLPAGPYRLGDRVPAEELARGAAIEVGGQIVGTALATGQPPEIGPRERHYLARTTRSSLYAALAATVIALILGVFLARALIRPVRDLIEATRAVAQGEPVAQIPVRSQDELGELTAAFNQMSADLARSTELRRQMTADIAHDLRTPLTVLAGYLEALRDGVLPPTPERFEMMHQEAQLLRRLVEDLRTLSLADAGELTLHREPFPPDLLLEQTAAAYRHQAEQQGIALHVQADPDLPALDIDPERMAQVLGNLVSNALRYTPAGGRITLAARRQGEAVLLTVTDTGSGIPPEALPHIFDRFYRGEAARPGESGGSGLGLTIARALVELHGGSITAESSPDRGTTFTITFAQ